MPKYIAMNIVRKEYYIGYNNGNNWGKINNAKKFDCIPWTDSNIVILEIKPDGKLIKVTR